MVVPGELIVKDWVTAVAAAKLALPAWLAVIEHVPAAMMVTVLPDTVQIDGVVEVNVTANPELAVALRVNGAAPSVTLLSAPNDIVGEIGPVVEAPSMSKAARMASAPWLDQVIPPSAEYSVCPSAPT